jgi:hypothetical protein
MRATYFCKPRRLSPKKKVTFLHGKSDFWHSLLASAFEQGNHLFFNRASFDFPLLLSLCAS